MKKPDRWERMVKETSEKIGGFWSDTGANLLREEHRWVRSMVKWLHQPLAEPGSVNYGYNQAIAFILEKLKERAK